MEDVHPEPIECLLGYIYTLTYVLGNGVSYGHTALWERHLDVAVIADRYDVPELEQQALAACIVDIAPRKSKKVPVAHLIARASFYHDRKARLSEVILRVVDAQFVALFENQTVQDWLDEYPKEPERFVVEHFDELIHA